MHCLTVLEARSPTSRYQQGWFPLKAEGKSIPASLLSSGGFLAISGTPWLAEALTPTSAFIFMWCVSLCMPKFPLFRRISVRSD